MASEGFVVTIYRWQKDFDFAVKNDKHVRVPVALGVQRRVLRHDLFATIALQPLNHFLRERWEREVATKISGYCLDDV
jgi:hypothetical protein